MISNSVTSLEYLQRFFNDQLTELELKDLIRIDTITQDTVFLNSLYIKNSQLKNINLENLEQAPFILNGNNIESINLNNLKRIESKNISYNSIFSYLYPSFLCNTKISELILPNFVGVTNTPYTSDYGGQNSNILPSFSNNYWLRNVCFGNANIKEIDTTHLNGYWFSNCYFLKYLRLLYPFFIPLSSNMGLSTTPIGSGKGRIYVPSNLVETYRAASYWNSYSDCIMPLEQYELDTQEDSEIPDSWPEIIARCNNGTAANYYQQYIGKYKTLKIDGKPTQMMLVNTANSTHNISNRDKKTDNSYAQLTWVEKTISRFERYNISSAFNYTSATNFQNIMSNIFNTIDSSTGLKEANGIKEVYKSAYGTQNGVTDNIEGSFKIWPPSIAEIGLRQSEAEKTYDYYVDNSPNYRLGETDIYTLDNSSSNICIALRDFEGSTSPATLQSGADRSIITQSSINPYIIFGFCT